VAHRGLVQSHQHVPEGTCGYRHDRRRARPCRAPAPGRSDSRPDDGLQCSRACAEALVCPVSTDRAADDFS
jgi:hypothetical protein